MKAYVPGFVPLSLGKSLGQCKLIELSIFKNKVIPVFE